MVISVDGGTYMLVDNGTGNLYISKDFGATWTLDASASQPGSSAGSISASANGTILAEDYWGSDNLEHLEISTDSGATWTVQTLTGLDGSTSYLPPQLTSDGLKLIAINQGGVLATSAGEVWTGTKA